MLVADIMTKKPATINVDDTLSKALTVMGEVGCRHLPVISADGHVVGVISDRDCRTAMNSPYVLHEKWQDDQLSRTLRVRTAMSPAPSVPDPGALAIEAARLILANHIGCLPVMVGETLVGIVTTSDFLMAFVNMQRNCRAAEQH